MWLYLLKEVWRLMQSRVALSRMCFPGVVIRMDTIRIATNSGLGATGHLLRALGVASIVTTTATSTM